MPVRETTVDMPGANQRGASTYATNTALNFLGQLVPMVIGIVAVPQLITRMGTERFGIITIAWMLIGYFGLFDMGLGRALTQLVAGQLGRNETDDIPAVFWTSSLLMFTLGSIGALLMATLVPLLVHRVLHIPVPLQAETMGALYILAISIPAVILTSAFVGFLSAYQRFDIINAIRIPMGTYNFAAPLLVLPFSVHLVPVITVLAAGRVVAFLVHLYFCLRIGPKLREQIVFRRAIMKPLFSFGGWMTVSNIVGPLMMYFDRFLIGALLSLSAVAYYTTPYEFVTKLWIIPTALLSVLFPAFASLYTQDASRAAELFWRTVRYMLLFLFPIVLIIVAASHQVLTLWLGSIFAEHSYRVLQWLAIGVFLNCLAQVPFTFLQGIGRPDITSKLHIVELLLYMPLLWFLVGRYGIEGGAVAWFLRMTFDTIVLFAIASRSCNLSGVLSRITRYCIVIAILFFITIMAIPNPYVNCALSVTGLLLFAAMTWKTMLLPEERALLAHKIIVVTKL